MAALGKKLRSMGDKDGNRIGFMHWCPGCDRPHGIWTEQRNAKGATCTHALSGKTVPLPDWPDSHKDFAS